MQGPNLSIRGNLIIHTHSHTDGTAIRSNLGLSILPKDISTRGLEEPGIEPPIFRLVIDPLYLLSHSRQSNNLTLNISKMKEMVVGFRRQ